MSTDFRAQSRRHFLRFLAESPLLYGGIAGALASSARAQDDAVLSGSLKFTGTITSPDQALNVWDFEAALRSRLNPGHYAYMAQGSDDFGTIAANRAGFTKIGLRPHRLVDIPNPDLSVEVFGQRLNAPIFLCPVGAQLMFHPEGEVAVARAEKRRTRCRCCRPSRIIPSRTWRARGAVPVGSSSTRRRTGRARSAC